MTGCSVSSIVSYYHGSNPTESSPPFLTMTSVASMQKKWALKYRVTPMGIKNKKRFAYQYKRLAMPNTFNGDDVVITELKAHA